MAFFVNRYLSNGPDKNIRKIIKYTNDFYLIGESFNKGFVTKINTLGDVQWSKLYSFSNSSIPVKFLEAVDTGQNIILGYSSRHSNTQNSAGLCAIDYNGNLIWNKEIFSSLNYPYNGSFQFRAIHFQTLNFVSGFLYATFVDRIMTTNNTTKDRIVCYKISSQGEPVLRKRINLSNQAYQTNISFHNNTFIIVGQSLPNNDGFIGTIDLNFSQINIHLLSYTNPNFVINISKVSNVINDKIFIIGTTFDTVNLSLFIARIDLKNYQLEIFKRLNDLIIFPLNSFYFYGNNIYIDTNFDGLFKFDNNVNFVWNKKIESAHSGIGEISEDTIKLILQKEGLASTNLELDSCITENNISNINLNIENGYTIINDGILSIESFSEAVSTPTIIVTTLEVTKSNLCPSTPILDINQSTIVANPTSIPTGGGIQGQSIITVRLYDTDGNQIISGTYNVQIINFNNVGTLSSTQGNNGTYTAILTSSNQEESAILKFSVSGLVIVTIWLVFNLLN